MLGLHGCIAYHVLLFRKMVSGFVEGLTQGGGAGWMFPDSREDLRVAAAAGVLSLIWRLSLLCFRLFHFLVFFKDKLTFL